MTPPIRQRPVVITDPDAAALLLDARALRMLGPFMGRALNAQAAAREAGVPISTLNYRLGQFLACGLLRRAGTQRRAGRPMPLYEAPAAVFVPFSATPLVAEALLSEIGFQALQEKLVRSVGAAWVAAAGERRLGLHLMGSGGVVTRNVEPEPDPDAHAAFFQRLMGPGAPAVWDSWAQLRLSDAQAKGLQAELAALMERWVGGHHANTEGRVHLLRLALAPLAPEPDAGS